MSTLTLLFLFVLVVGFGWRFAIGPTAHNIGDLFEIAQMLAAANLNESGRRTLDADEVLTTIESFANTELDGLIQQGWVGHKVESGARRLTAKGSALMAWKLLWPLNNILDQQQLASARKVLHRAGGSHLLSR